MKKVKCEIIPVSLYDKTPPVVYEDDRWRYILGKTKRHLIRLNKKTCFLCCKSAVFVVIFNYKKHNKVIRCCSEHASAFGTLPPTPVAHIPAEISKDIPEITAEAIRKWNMQIKI